MSTLLIFELWPPDERRGIEAARLASEYSQGTAFEDMLDPANPRTAGLDYLEIVRILNFDESGNQVGDLEFEWHPFRKADTPTEDRNDGGDK